MLGSTTGQPGEVLGTHMWIENSKKGSYALVYDGEVCVAYVAEGWCVRGPEMKDQAE